MARSWPRFGRQELDNAGFKQADQLHLTKCPAGAGCCQPQDADGVPSKGLKSDLRVRHSYRLLQNTGFWELFRHSLSCHGQSQISTVIELLDGKWQLGVMMFRC